MQFRGCLPRPQGRLTNGQVFHHLSAQKQPKTLARYRHSPGLLDGEIPHLPK